MSANVQLNDTVGDASEVCMVDCKQSYTNNAKRCEGFGALQEQELEKTLDCIDEAVDVAQQCVKACDQVDSTVMRSERRCVKDALCMH